MLLLEKIYNFTVSFMKVNIQVSPFLLNNFLDTLADTDWPKVLKLSSIKYEKTHKITYENITNLWSKFWKILALLIKKNVWNILKIKERERNKKFIIKDKQKNN